MRSTSVSALFAIEAQVIMIGRMIVKYDSLKCLNTFMEILIILAHPDLCIWSKSSRSSLNAEADR